MAIYISGDTHGNFRRFFSKAYFPEMENLTKKDLLIICGDFGGVWDEKESSETERKLLDELNDLNCTIAFCDGNHENHSRLDELPVTEFHEGKAHQIRESVWHLMRGQVYVYGNVKIMVMGGGSSHDKKFRKENVSWWARELPSDEEYEEARRNLLKQGNKVDLIISHVAPSSLQEKVWGWRECYPRDSLTNFLEEVFHTVTFRKWCFGHYHCNKILNQGKMVCIFDNIMRLDLQNFPFDLEYALGYSKEDLAKGNVILPNEIYEYIDKLDTFMDNPKKGKIRIFSCDSLKAAELLTREGESGISVLNFCNVKRPGGSVLELGRGIAQEEVLCLRSSLLLSLLSKEAETFYQEGKRSGDIGIDGGIFSPHVFVSKNEAFELVPEQDQFMVSVISCGAPEVSPISHRLQDFSETEMLAVIRRRILCIFAIAANFGVENIILGAFGCGAFGNDPSYVASSFRQLLEDETLKHIFKHVVFAIPPGKNFDLFYEELKDLT